MYKIQMILLSALLTVMFACGNTTENTDSQPVNESKIESKEDQNAPSTQMVSQEEKNERSEEKLNKQENIEKVDDKKEKVTKVEPEKKVNSSPKAKTVTEKETPQEKVEAPVKEAIEKTAASVSPPAPTPKAPEKEKAPIVEAPTPTVVPAKEVEKKKEEIKKSVPIKVPLSHDSWNSLLAKHVSSSGKVNYAGFKSDQAKMDAYLKLLADNPVQSSWARNKKLAYWINAYNAFTVKLIVDNYPVTSITKLHGGKPWDAKWIKLGSKTYSLNNIENDIIRPQFKEPRIHFAVNCAAKSCPPIINKAWTASNLNSLFEQQAKKFINNPSFNKIAANKIQVSKIFDWYGEDFGSLIDYLNKYTTTKINSNAKVEFIDYDWSLNN